MPKQKDLKRVVRARMQKTGESYTAARLHIVRRTDPEPDYAELAGMKDESVRRSTGRDWREWVKLLDAAECATKPHPEIARYIASLGMPSWWSQTVTVGYERIKGLREKGQRRGAGYEAHKSRTFTVPLRTLFTAFADEAFRTQWLLDEVTVKSATANKRMRIAMSDTTVVEIGFVAKSETKSAATIQHQNLPDKATAERMKAWWAERFDALAERLDGLPASRFS